jgi:hypothetical protein
MPAHNDVHLRLVEHVAHVQATSYVRRRQQQREHGTRLARWRRWHGEELLFNPVFGPARFNRTRFVGFGKVVGHEKAFSTQQLACSHGGRHGVRQIPAER